MSIPFIWFDLAAADTGEAVEFYREMFGWDVADAGVGGYQSWIGAGQPWAGIVAAAPGSAGQWLPYIVVDDLDRATKQAVSLGAIVVRDATDGPAGASVTIADPGGGPAGPVQTPPRRVIAVTGERLFWQLAEPLLAEPAVTRSTMMGLPCLRLHGRFFASLDRHTQALLVKLPVDRVNALIAAGHAEPFAPAGRAFREWATLTRPDRRRWQTLLNEARQFAAGAPE